jgi:hypothetical protein
MSDIHFPFLVLGAFSLLGSALAWAFCDEFRSRRRS